MLKEIFSSLLLNYTKDYNLINQWWSEVEENHSNKTRHYHTLAHLENLIIQLKEVKDKINNWETVLFTVFYHDIVYNPLKSNNEEQSANYAEQRMHQLSVPTERIAACKAQILATKAHMNNSESDTNYFTDADLSILGQSWEAYKAYFQQVRKEYSIYPSIIYNPGRKKVLHHFLAMESIYKTEYFIKKFERQAKQNLQKELELL